MANQLKKAMTVIFAHLICVASALSSSPSALDSDISAIDKAIKSLESSSGWWDKSLPWFTGLVVFGLLVDLVVIVWERREEMAGWHRWVSLGLHFPDRPTRCKFILELIATNAIFFGVAGEFWAGVKIASINGQLRSRNAELRSKSEELIGILRRDAEEAKRQTAELQKAGLPRYIDPKRVAGQLGSFTNAPVRFAAISDFETLHITALIEAALMDSKWGIWGDVSVTTGGRLPKVLSTPGIWIEAAPDGGNISVKERSARLAKVTRAANALVTALTDEGLEAKYRRYSGPDFTTGLGDDGAVHVFVSLKPFPGMPSSLRVVFPKPLGP